MPAQVTDVDLLQQYLLGVMSRADHHASNANEIVLSLAGALIWRKDAQPLEVMEREGDMKNVLWVRISGERYSLSYNHETGCIEMKKGGTQGALVKELSNKISAAEIKAFFTTL